MTLRVLFAAVVPVLFLCCGGDDNARLEEDEYFAELEAIDHSAFETLSEATTAPESIDEVSPLKQVLGQATELAPPESLLTEHDRLLSAASSYAATVDELEEVSPEPTGDAAQADRLLEALEDWGRACVDMLERGAEADLRLKLLCGYFIEGNDGEVECLPAGPGFSLCPADPPPIPEGLTPLSEYFEVTGERTGAIIGIRLNSIQSSPQGIAFYSFEDDEWVRLGNVVLIQDGTLAQGEFDLLPENMIVLRDN